MSEPKWRAPTPFTVAVHFGALLFDYVAQRGISLETLLKRTALSKASLINPNGRMRFDDFSRLCEDAAEMLGDPDLGLKLGRNVRAGHLGSHGFALMSCSTAAEMMQQSTRYSSLTMDAGRNVFELHGDEWTRIWRSNLAEGAPLGRIQDDLNQSMYLTLSRWLTNRDDVNVNWASFRHARPADVSEYEAFFRCPLSFGATDTAIGFDASYLLHPMPHANALLRRAMDDVCAQLLGQLRGAHEPAWLAIARKAALESFRGGALEPSVIAAKAGLSESEFRERLSSRGLSFREFVDDLRCALALVYARDQSLSLVDIAYLLGFSEQSAFNRAFKRWTGLTPGAYRRHPAEPTSASVKVT